MNSSVVRAAPKIGYIAGHNCCGQGLVLLSENKIGDMKVFGNTYYWMVSVFNQPYQQLNIFVIWINHYHNIKNINKTQR